MTNLSLHPLNRFLEKLTSRSVLSAAERQAILSLPGHPVQVEYNRDFVRPGDKVDHVSLVVDGLVGRFGQNSEGQRQIVTVHIPGDVADLYSVVAPDAPSALNALTTSTIMKIPHAALREAARRHPAIAEAFWRECVVDAAVLAEWVVNVGRRNARARAAHLLCEMACRYGAAGGQADFDFTFPVTQNHLADILALTPVHVNRTLNVLRREEVAEVVRHHVRIPDWQRIVAVGEFDASYLKIGQSANDNPVAPLRRMAR